MKTAKEAIKEKYIVLGEDENGKDVCLHDDAVSFDDTVELLESYARQHAIEFKNYVQENYGYTDRAFTVPDSAYDEWIESKE